MGASDHDKSALLRAAEAALIEERRRFEALTRIAAAAHMHGEVEAVIQAVVDGAVALTGAQFGAFFHNTTDPSGEHYALYTLSGASREAFARFPSVRATSLLSHTFENQGVLRSGDILADPRYGRNAPYYGMPEGHLPVRSYLAAPVATPQGEVLGGLFFGHAEKDRFSPNAESLLLGLAAQAAAAIQGARLTEALRQELAERRQAEARQELLLHELNHRVKNTLATVQSIARQTARFAGSLADFGRDFEARLVALSRTHDLLTQQGWAGADLAEVCRIELAPFGSEGERLTLAPGPQVRLNPKAALALGMAFHELATNAAKYGALSTPSGRIKVGWRTDDEALHLTWSEHDGPPVVRPTRRGFGSRLLGGGLARELSGAVHLDYDPAGLTCAMQLPRKALEP